MIPRHGSETRVILFALFCGFPSEFSFLPPACNRPAKNFSGNTPPPDFIARYTRRRISSRKFARHLDRHFRSLVRVACLRQRNSSYSFVFFPATAKSTVKRLHVNCRVWYRRVEWNNGVFSSINRACNFSQIIFTSDNSVYSMPLQFKAN